MQFPALLLLAGLMAQAPLPQPNLDAMEPAVRAQLEEARTQLDVQLAQAASDAEAAEALGQLGRLYLAYQLYDVAAPCLEEARRRQPGDFRWAYYLGTLYQAQRQLEPAAEQLRAALDLDPQQPALALAAHLRLAEVELTASRWKEAEEHFRRALELAPECAAAHEGLGRAAAFEGRAEEAVAHFEQALALQPQATAIHHALGLALRDLGRRDEAREQLTLARDGGNQPVRFPDPLTESLAGLTTGAAGSLLAANRALRRGDVEAAVAGFRQALEVDPENLAARQGLAAALVKAGNDGAAEAEYRAILAREPDSANSRYALGNLLARRGDLNGALEALRQATALAPELKDAHFNLGLVLVRLGRDTEAESSFARVLAIDPQDRAARRQRAEVLERLGRGAEALAELRQLVTTDPQDFAAQLSLAGTLARRGELLPAAEAFNQAVALDPTALPAHFGRFTALLLAEHYPEALKALESSRRQLPGTLPLDHALARFLATCPNPDLRNGSRSLELALAVFQARPAIDHGETVAMAYAELGRFEEAIAWQERVLAEIDRTGRHDLRPAASRRLEGYRRAQPCRAPWLPEG